jgi:hypothetical protein
MVHRQPEDHEVEDARQLGKVNNFGYPGGMGHVKFVQQAASQGINISEQQSRELKSKWFRVWPEMPGFFDMVSRVTEQRGEIRNFSRNASAVELALPMAVTRSFRASRQTSPKRQASSSLERATSER